jgi:hypothetical protein
MKRPERLAPERVEQSFAVLFDAVARAELLLHLFVTSGSL